MYAINLLNERLESLQDAYDRYVINGSVDPTSEPAISNYRKQRELAIAIDILKSKIK